MAASGIAEHDEARRRERVYLRKAYLMRQEQQLKKEQLAKIEAEIKAGKRCATSYETEVRRLKSMGQLGGHDQQSVDQQRREAHRQQMRQEYSAKLPNRYTSIDYISQW